MAALVCEGLKNILSRGPAISTESGLPFLSVQDK
jgi:hypothetical protein